MTDLTVAAVTRRYGKVAAVENLSFAVDKGEFVTLLGPSGCGKTTTLRMIAGFVSPDEGRIEIGGHDVTREPPDRRNVGLVFQSYALFPHMTVGDNIGFGLRMRGQSGSQRRPRVAEALDMVRLAGFEDRYPAQLSGGQQQRVALARALVFGPQLLLLDEPFGALDKQLRDHMREELLGLQRRLGIATVFVTHDQLEALSMSDRVLVMKDGRLEQAGSPAEIYEQPRSRFVAEFMGRSNLVEMSVLDRRADIVCLADGPLRVEVPGARDFPIGSTVTVMIRPESIGLSGNPEAGSGNAGRVVSVTYLGAAIQVRLVLEGGRQLEALTTPREMAAGAIAVGAEIGLTIHPAGVWIIGDSRGQAPR